MKKVGPFKMTRVKFWAKEEAALIPAPAPLEFSAPHPSPMMLKNLRAVCC